MLFRSHGQPVRVIPEAIRDIRTGGALSQHLAEGVVFGMANDLAGGVGLFDDRAAGVIRIMNVVSRSAFGDCTANPAADSGLRRITGLTVR